MSTPQLERLQAHCQRLRLSQVAAELPSLLEQAAKAERSYTDFLEEVLRREVQAKTDKHLAMRLAMARSRSRRRWRPSTLRSSLPLM